MALHAFSLYEVKIRKVRSDEYLPIAAFGSNRRDFLSLYSDFLDSELKGRGKRIDKSEKYLRLKDSEVDFRTMWFTVETGSYGVTGKVVATNTGTDSYDIQTTDAASYPVRQALVVPMVGDCALWATESVGHTSAFGGLCASFKEWLREKFDTERYVVEFNHFQDTNAWNEFIDRSSLKEITYVVHQQDADGAVGSRIQEHRVKAVRRRRLPSAWIKQAMEKRLPSDTVFSVRVPEADEVRMQIESEGRSRTIVVDHELPRFMYELGDASSGTPTDETFRSAVLSEVGASLDYMHVSRRTWQG
ncbi:hypothetical protein A6P39_020460 [Streptomyces sp. FXJ1.172]|uniref:hypothetical protein n=1 Tax=Streptomyces sp. FXJ1.172 TaxID=710705 RepID=UPI0007CEFFF2|nr:hypothetical protein [Streptomyces sp. FXJ1.172]WEO96215.1 hypothetical protein A6P39_020460 [Streptomyces sp. FXJ1.172]